MQSGIMLAKQFLVEAKDVLDDSYVSAALVPAKEPGQVTGIGFSIHDGHSSICLRFPVGGMAELDLIKTVVGRLQKVLGVVAATAEMLTKEAGAKEAGAAATKPALRLADGDPVGDPEPDSV